MNNIDEKRIGVYVCSCGTNIANMVDVDKVVEKAKELPCVVLAKNYKYMCSDPGQDLIINDILEYNLNRIVVAACSPRIHELTFRKAAQKAGLNPYLVEIANIREHVSWVHTDRDKATAKAISHTAAAVYRVMYHEPLERRTVKINPATLVIGGGIAGITAALEIANAGKKVYLIEKSSVLGGRVAHLDLLFPYMFSASQLIQPKINQVENHPHITVIKNADIEELSGYMGNFHARIKSGKELIEFDFGNMIIATGLKTYDPILLENYGYGKLPEVITSEEFEEMMLKGKISPLDKDKYKNIAIIHCVGSRDKNIHEYCSRVCCSTALKYSNQLRQLLPDSNIYQVYADIRSFGKGCEEMYKETQKKNIMFLNFDKDDRPIIRAPREGEDGKVIIEMNEALFREPIALSADLVILMVGLEAHEDAKEMAQKTGISLCGNDFFIEKHPKLDPVATTTDGVYIVGTCQGPKDISDTIAQARAASARILSAIARGEYEMEVITAEVNEEICCGCQTCVNVCPYSAISFDEEKNVSHVNELLCKGCGTCSGACGSAAIKSHHYTVDQIMAQIEGLMALKF